MEAVIGPISPGARIKAILPGIARKLGFTLRRARALWNGEAARIESHEMDVLRAAAAQAEASRTAAQIDGAANALLALGEDCDRATIDRLRRVAGDLRNAASPKGRV
jgi:hypothetical protein